MNLLKLNIEQLFEVRSNMVLNKETDFDEINFLIEKREQEYVDSIFEDESGTGGPAGASTTSVFGGGVAYGTANTAGMGPVVSAQPSTLPGSTTGNNYYGNGGSDGSGDIGVPINLGGNKMFQKVPVGEMGKGHGPRTGKKSRTKKMDIKSLKNAFANRQDFTANQGNAPKQKRVMSFDDYQKDVFSKVTKVKDL